MLKIVEKNGAASRNSAFMKGFKKIMHLPLDYKLSQTDLFRMFLRELQVRSELIAALEDGDRVGSCRSQSIDDLCRQEINLVK